MKNILWAKSTTLDYDAKLRFLPNCSYHFILLGTLENLLQKLDTLCFIYQHVDCLYIVFKYWFNGNIVVKSGQVFDHVQEAVYFNQRNTRVDSMPSTVKEETLEQKYKKHFFELLP